MHSVHGLWLHVGSKGQKFAEVVEVSLIGCMTKSCRIMRMLGMRQDQRLMWVRLLLSLIAQEKGRGNDHL